MRTTFDDNKRGPAARPESLQRISDDIRPHDLIWSGSGRYGVGTESELVRVTARTAGVAP
jgi:hypothetical protein